MTLRETPAQRKRQKLLFALQQRQKSTAAEDALWQALRRHGLKGLKFRRQVPIGRFIVDFLCMQRSLVVEVDGPIHDAQRAYDEARDEELRRRGYRVLRVTNVDVTENLAKTLITIADAAAAPLGTSHV